MPYPFFRHTRIIRGEEYPNCTMTASDMIARIFPMERFGTKVPPMINGSCEIQGVRVEYMTVPGARAFWGPRRRNAIRAIATCPHCSKVVAASRLNQHYVVHVDTTKDWVVEYRDELGDKTVEEFRTYKSADKVAKNRRNAGCTNINVYRKGE